MNGTTKRISNVIELNAVHIERNSLCFDRVDINLNAFKCVRAVFMSREIA